MRPAQRANLWRLLAPRHIAVVGGTDAITAITEARRRGFAGQIWAVNPRRTELAGIPCVPRLADLPAAPDAAYVAIPAAAAVEAVAELAGMDAGGAVVYSAGFKEAGQEGRALEERLCAISGDLAVIGPNCYGMINYMDRAALWSFAHGGSCPGYGAAIITQSGMFSSDITMSQRSLPLAYMISAGNMAVLGIADFLEALSEAPGVRAVGLHIEGLTDVPRFEAAARAALQRGVPVVALKTGRSKIGGALTESHTGSLSGETALYEALFARTGVISVTNPSQLLETLKYLCVVGAPAGRRVAGFTCSGGGATMLADHGEAIGLSFPEVQPAARDRLTALLPPIATVSNPLDYTTPIWGQAEHTGPVFAAALEGMAADATVLVQDYPLESLKGSKISYEIDARAFADAAAAAGTPAAICATLPENLDRTTRDALIARGVAPMQGVHETLNAIEQAAAWRTARARLLDAPPVPLCPAAVRAARPLTEAEAKAWLKASGLPVPDGCVASAADAPDAAARLGFPVALKMLSPEIAHKTEAGTVTLGLATREAVARECSAMSARLARSAPSAARDAYLVEKMAPPPVAEMIVGLRRDSQFGLVLTLGSGGVLAELIADTATLLLPAGPGEIERALAGLKMARLLAGFRGRPPVPLAPLAARLHSLAERMEAARPRIQELEINPLFLYPESVLAIDALMLREPER